MFQSTAASIRERRRRLATVLLVLAMVLGAIPFTVSPAGVSANHTNIKWPFPKGSNWVISQGYNTSPTGSGGGSHWNCNPTTLRDDPSGTMSCSRYYQYKFALDLRKQTGETAGQTVLSPVNGTIRWIDPAYGGMSIDLGDGYAFAYFHTTLAAGLKAGQTVTQGDILGTVAPPGEGGNGGFPHIHVELWATTDGGNWSRTAVPLSGEQAIDGYDLAHLGESVRNQHQGKVIVSSNVPRNVGGGEVPSAPALLTPATGTNFPIVNSAPTLTWATASGATEYMVRVNDGAITSPWIAATSYKLPSLATGQYAWQVKARNTSGESGWSAKYVFWINSNGTVPTPTPTGTPPTGTPGPLSLKLNRTTAFFGAEVVTTGSGFGANEVVKFYLDSQSNAALAQTTSAANGSFSFTLGMPEVAGGNHTIIARGATSTKRATATLRMTSTLTRDPVQGPPGTKISVIVYGFGASEQVRLNFDSETGRVLGTMTTNAKGTGTVSITMPEATGGWHDYVGAGLTSGFRGYGALLVNTQVVLTPDSGLPATSVGLTAKGFPANESVTVAWNKSIGNAGTNVCTGKTSALGTFSCSFVAPQSIAGAYPVAVTSTSAVTANATFSVTGAAGVQISPSTGAVSANITIAGGGFNANEQIQLLWGSNTTAWATVQANSSGSFSYPATVPTLSTGAQTFKARGVTSNKTSTTTFTVTGSGGSSGSSMIAPGTYRITATREGLVGGRTSNGHIITELDHFVSLPACTKSSCPWLTPGGSTYVADCGTNCFVKVTNPVTNACSVAEVYDVGPWFTNDNWWDPANKRVLNNLPTTVNILAQGYTGADAAVNGLDVGYGISDGKGISNKGYRMVSRASLDIADGTWVDIGFLMPEGKREVIATMLWQTGEDHVAAAAACGQGPTVPAVSISKKNGPAGTVLNVKGTDLAANKPVAIFFDSIKNAPLATVNATSAGTIDQPITIPNVAGGNHKIIIVATDSNLRTARTFKVTPSVSISPLAGQALRTVTVSVKNFAPNEAATVYWDGSSTGAGGTTVNSSGAGTLTTRAPWTNGAHTAVVRSASGLTVSFSFNVTPRIKLTPASGTGSTTISVRGTGFAPGIAVNVFWDNAVSSKLVCSAVTSNDKGAFTCAGRPITGSAAGDHTLIAISGGLTAKATFAVTSVASAELPTTEATPEATATEAPATVEPEETPTATTTQAATETPTPEQTIEPTIVPTEEPTQLPPTYTPEPVAREIVLYPIADASVMRSDDGSVASAAEAGSLIAGGTEGTAALMTFSVDGVAPGAVIDATLVLTGTGAASDGGTLRVASGVVIDEVSATYETLPLTDLPQAGAIGAIQPGTETTIDVSGVVAADGTFTFVVRGTRDGVVQFGSREGGAPPRLVIHVIDPNA